MALGTWITWASYRVSQDQVAKTYPELNNRLPISSVVAPVVALSFMCLTLTQTGTSWLSDVSLAVVNSAPPMLLQIHLSLALQELSFEKPIVSHYFLVKATSKLSGRLRRACPLRCALWPSKA
eukprot:g30865.t1